MLYNTPEQHLSTAKHFLRNTKVNNKKVLEIINRVFAPRRLLDYNKGELVQKLKNRVIKLILK